MPAVRELPSSAEGIGAHDELGAAEPAQPPRQRAVQFAEQEEASQLELPRPEPEPEPASEPSDMEHELDPGWFESEPESDSEPDGQLPGVVRRARPSLDSDAMLAVIAAQKAHGAKTALGTPSPVPEDAELSSKAGLSPAKFSVQARRSAARAVMTLETAAVTEQVRQGVHEDSEHVDAELQERRALSNARYAAKVKAKRRARNQTDGDFAREAMRATMAVDLRRKSLGMAVAPETSALLKQEQEDREKIKNRQAMQRTASNKRYAEQVKKRRLKRGLTQGSFSRRVASEAQGWTEKGAAARCGCFAGCRKTCKRLHCVAHDKIEHRYQIPNSRAWDHKLEVRNGKRKRAQRLVKHMLDERLQDVIICGVLMLYLFSLLAVTGKETGRALMIPLCLVGSVVCLYGVKYASRECFEEELNKAPGFWAVAQVVWLYAIVFQLIPVMLMTPGSGSAEDAQQGQNGSEPEPEPAGVSQDTLGAFGCLWYSLGVWSMGWLFLWYHWERCSVLTPSMQQRSLLPVGWYPMLKVVSVVLEGWHYSAFSFFAAVPWRLVPVPAIGNHSLPAPQQLMQASMLEFENVAIRHVVFFGACATVVFSGIGLVLTSHRPGRHSQVVLIFFELLAFPLIKQLSSVFSCTSTDICHWEDGQQQRFCNVTGSDPDQQCMDNDPSQLCWESDTHLWYLLGVMCILTPYYLGALHVQLAAVARQSVVAKDATWCYISFQSKVFLALLASAFGDCHPEIILGAVSLVVAAQLVTLQCNRGRNKPHSSELQNGVDYSSVLSINCIHAVGLWLAAGNAVLGMLVLWYYRDSPSRCSVCSEEPTNEADEGQPLDFKIYWSWLLMNAMGAAVGRVWYAKQKRSWKYEMDFHLAKKAESGDFAVAGKQQWSMDPHGIWRRNGQELDVHRSWEAINGTDWADQVDYAVVVARVRNAQDLLRKAEQSSKVSDADPEAASSSVRHNHSVLSLSLIEKDDRFCGNHQQLQESTLQYVLAGPDSKQLRVRIHGIEDIVAVREYYRKDDRGLIMQRQQQEFSRQTVDHMQQNIKTQPSGDMLLTRLLKIHEAGERRARGRWSQFVHCWCCCVDHRTTLWNRLFRIIMCRCTCCDSSIVKAQIEELDLSGHGIHGNSITAILSKVINVQSVNLASCGIGSGPEGGDDTEILVQALRSRTHTDHMRRLVLSGNQIGDAKGVELVGAIRDTTIEELDISMCALGRGTADALAQLLPDRTSLFANNLKKLTMGVATAQYEVKLVTGSRLFAGTDATVSVQLFGARRASGLRVLSTGKKHFERGQVDQFQVVCHDLGRIERVKIGHDGDGCLDGWLLASVEVWKQGDPENERTKFICGKELKIHRDIEDPEDIEYRVDATLTCAGAQLAEFVFVPPQRHRHRPTSWFDAGLVLTENDEGEIVVKRVVEDSPASKLRTDAGGLRTSLSPGQRLRTIDGVAATNFHRALETMKSSWQNEEVLRLGFAAVAVIIERSLNPRDPVSEIAQHDTSQIYTLDCDTRTLDLSDHGLGPPDLGLVCGWVCKDSVMARLEEIILRTKPRDDVATTYETYTLTRSDARTKGFDLSGANLGTSDVILLSRWLATSLKTVTGGYTDSSMVSDEYKIDLCGCRIGGDATDADTRGAKELFACLTDVQPDSLNVREANLGPRCIRELAAYVGKRVRNTTDGLKRLDISSNQVQSEGRLDAWATLCTAIGESTVEEMVASNVGIEATGCKIFADSVHELTRKVDVSMNAITCTVGVGETGTASVQYDTDCSGLETLCMRMRVATQLETVSFAGCNIGPRSLNILAQVVSEISSLTDLDLSGCRLSETGRMVSGGSGLQELAVAIESCAIRKLKLDSTGVANEPRSFTLQTTDPWLDLSNFNLGEADLNLVVHWLRTDAASTSAFAWASLRGNALGNAAQSVVEQCERLDGLVNLEADLSDHEHRSGRDLSVWRTAELRMGAALKMGEIASIKRLDLSECWLVPAAVARIAALVDSATSLGELSLSGNKDLVGREDGFEKLCDSVCSSNSLWMLDLSGCRLNLSSLHTLSKALARPQGGAWISQLNVARNKIDDLLPRDSKQRMDTSGMDALIRAFARSQAQSMALHVSEDLYFRLLPEFNAAKGTARENYKSFDVLTEDEARSFFQPGRVQEPMRASPPIARRNEMRYGDSDDDGEDDY